MSPLRQEVTIAWLARLTWSLSSSFLHGKSPSCWLPTLCAAYFLLVPCTQCPRDVSPICLYPSRTCLCLCLCRAMAGAVHGPCSPSTPKRKARRHPYCGVPGRRQEQNRVALLRLWPGDDALPARGPRRASGDPMISTSPQTTKVLFLLISTIEAGVQHPHYPQSRYSCCFP